MDCFYAAVEVKHHPELRGKPLGIGGPPDSRSVLCTASYEARKFGVRSAMPSSQAVRLCPQLILKRPNFELYRRETQAIREIFSRFTSRIEPLSLDEAYLDVTDAPHFDGSATRIAAEIRRLIRAECGLTASAGVAPNKFLAKVASDWRKPDGLFVVRPEEVAAFVKTLPVEKIFGVGRVTAERLHRLGWRTCGDLQLASREHLAEEFGSRGESLYGLARGEDRREVEARSERKSLSVEETFERDLPTLEEGLRALPELYADWERRMTRAKAFDRLRGFVVKIKFFDFRTTTCEVACAMRPRARDFVELLREAWGRRPVPFRLIGIGARLGGDETSDEAPLQLSFAW